MCNFSLHYQYDVNQTGDENKENHPLSDAIWCNTKFYEITLKRNVWPSVRRINIQIVGVNELITAPR